MTMPVTMPAAIVQLLAQAEAAGASAELIIDQQTQLSLKARQGQLSEQSSSHTQILGLRVIKDQRVGLAYSEADDPEALDFLLTQALLNAQFSEPKADEQLLAHDQQLITDDALLCPDSPLSLVERIDQLLALEAELLAQPQITNVPYNGFVEQLQQREIYSTSGLRALSRERLNSLYAYALADDGQGQTAMYGAGQAERQAEQLSPKQLVAQVAKEAQAMLTGKGLPSASLDVIFDANTQAELWQTFGLVFSGKSAVDGINPWRDRLGSQQASSLINLYDRPHDVNGLAYSLFDAEGTPCQDLGLLVQGQFQAMRHNSYSARKLNAALTGHASRGPKSGLAVSGHQLCLQAGETGVRALQAGEYLWVTQLTGLHSGTNAVTGDFSLGVSGYLCRDGQPVQVVRGVTLAGNFYQLLHQVQAVGDQQHWNWQRNCHMASVRLAGLKLSG